MSGTFSFEHRVEFFPGHAEDILRAIPAAPGVVALRGEAQGSEPYLTRTADLRRRLRRLLAPPEALDEQGRPVLSKRLNLREKVRWIDWTRTGSDFESSVVLYCATCEAFGSEQARKRLRLHAPYFLRITLQHQHPRVYATNRLSRRSLAESLGPFPSRAAAERYCDAVLDLFKLRRCHEDLQVHPDHPGCAYGEMKKCMEPCKAVCTAAEYSAEAERVRAFFATRGESMLTEIAVQREAASEAMDFEQAAALHKQWERAKAAAGLADELVRPVAELRAVILQEASPPEDEAHVEEAAVFLLERGRVTGPARLSTLGVRAVREQTAVGSSLFAQPLMLAAIPLNETAQSASSSDIASPTYIAPSTDLAIVNNAKDLLPSGPLTIPNQSATHAAPGSAPTANLLSRPESESIADGVERPDPPYAAASAASTLSPEERARAVLHHLHELATGHATPLDETCDYLALFRRWYYRPEKQRTGEVFLPNPDEQWPIRRMLNGAARVALGTPVLAAPVNREAFKDLKTKVIHEGREGVERVVPILPKRSRGRKSAPASEGSSS